MTAGSADVRRLLVMRHARAERPAALTDELRPLSLDGRRQCGDVARRLLADGLLPEHVLVSSAVRTRQTWDLLRTGLGDAPEPSVDVTDRAYEATPGTLLALLQEVDERVRTVLLVAHEPGVSGLCSFLAGRDGEGEHVDVVRQGLPTGACVVLRPTVRWADLSPGSAAVDDVLRPQR